MDETTITECVNSKNETLKNIHEIAVERILDPWYIDFLIGDLNPHCEMCVCALSLWDLHIEDPSLAAGRPFCGICIKLAKKSYVDECDIVGGSSATTTFPAQEEHIFTETESLGHT